MRFTKLFLSLVFLTVIGCDNAPRSQQNPEPVTVEAVAVQAATTVPPASVGPVTEQITKAFQPFFIYSDKGTRQNHYTPSGFMPNGKCIKFNDRWVENCQSGKTCIRVHYDVKCSLEDQGWAGIYWLNPPNNWGVRKGGYNLVGAKKLTFWAKGEQGGERIEEFKIGGIYGDFPDTDNAMIGPVILTNEWREYSIDLRGKDLSYISGGFSWSTNVDANPEDCIFYLDNLVYE